MKTAISVPDATFDDVSRAASRMGISRSEFFARAARRYLDELETATLRARIDEVLGSATPDDSNAAAAAHGRAILRAGDDW
jgi:metal-responsive CopG/Arc/MetJ family transcriptional regulator